MTSSILQLQLRVCQGCRRLWAWSSVAYWTPPIRSPKTAPSLCPKLDPHLSPQWPLPLFSFLQWRETPHPSHTHWKPGFHPSLLLLSDPLHLISYQASHILLLKYFSKPSPSLYPCYTILAQILLISPLYHYRILLRLFSESMHCTPGSVLNTFSPVTLWILVTTVCWSSQPLSHSQLFCHPTDCSPPGSSVRGILQARILEWVAIPFSRGASWPRDRTCISCIAGGFFTIWSFREADTFQVSIKDLSKRLDE